MEHRKKRQIAIIGAGASGCMAAVFATVQNAQVTIYERNDRIGKKLLVTGNGRCNLANLNLSASAYVSESVQKETFLVKAFAQYGVTEVLTLFHEMGLMTKAKGEFVYPESMQAASVQDLFRYHLEQENIVIKTGHLVTDLQYSAQEQQFVIRSQELKQDKLNTERYDRVIVATGGCASPKTGSDGSLVSILKRLGHTIIPACPGLVQLQCSGVQFKAMSGVRCDAAITIDGNTERGELQLTDYGISGFPVFQLSLEVCRKLQTYKERSHQEQSAQLKGSIDFLPELTEQAILEELCRRHEMYLRLNKENTVEQVVSGLIHKKVMLVLLKRSHLQADSKLNTLGVSKQLSQIYAPLVREIKHMEFTVTGDNGFANAQVSTGGVCIDEVTDEMESRRIKGLYLTGELLDITGKCGGYNLQWAWTSGILAGRAAASE